MDAERKRKRVATILKLVGGFFAVAILGPFATLALKGILGLAAVAVAGLVGFAALKFSAVISMKISNRVIKEIAKEAEANPIETLQSLQVEKTEELKSADLAIIDFETEVRNYDDQTKEFKKQYPEEAPMYEEIGVKMHQGLEEKKSRQAEARQVLSELEMTIRKAKAIYKMSLAARKVTTLSKSAEQEVYQGIKEQVSLDTVRSELNRAFASLNVAITNKTPVMLPAPKTTLPSDIQTKKVVAEIIK